MQNYGIVDLEKIKQIHENVVKSSSHLSNQEFTTFTPKTGPNIIRILPPPTGKCIPFKELGYHYIAKNKSFLCPRVLENSKCYICENVDGLYQSSLQDAKDVADAWRVQLKGAFNIVDRSDGQVKVWISSPATYRKITELISTWESLYEKSPLFTDPEQGRDIVLTKTVTPKRGGGTQERYEIQVLDRKPLHPDKTKMNEILEQIIDLDTAFRSMGYDKLKETFSSFEVEVESRLEKTIPEEQPKQPQCYGIEYDAKDDECDKCSYSDGCLDTIREKKKEKPKSDEEKPKSDEVKPKSDEVKPKSDEVKPKSEESSPGETVDSILANARKQRKDK